VPDCGQKSLFVCYHLRNIEPAVEVVKIYSSKAVMISVFINPWRSALFLDLFIYEEKIRDCQRLMLTPMIE
jgi:hypothetical protein